MKQNLVSVYEPVCVCVQQLLSLFAAYLPQFTPILTQQELISRLNH